MENKVVIEEDNVFYMNVLKYNEEDPDQGTTEEIPEGRKMKHFLRVP